MVNIRRVQSERLPKAVGSPRVEVGEIDTRAPFQSVRAAVSLFGEVAVPKDIKRTISRKSRLSAENVIDKETQLMLAQKELNKIKQTLESAESTKVKADADLANTKATLQDLMSRLEAVALSKQSVMEDAEALKERLNLLELQQSQNHHETSAWKLEVEHARNQYLAVSSQLDAAKQELNKIRQDFDAALEAKLAAFQQAAEGQRLAKLHSDRVSELSKEISAMKETTQQVRIATQQTTQEQADITGEREALQKSYKSALQESEKNLTSLKKGYDPELTKRLEDKLTETTSDVEALKEEMKKAHALEMDSVRIITTELNEATTTLQQVAEEENSLRNWVSSLRAELEDVVKRKGEAAERLKVKEAAVDREFNARLQHYSSEADNARSEEDKMKKSAQELKIEAKAAKAAEEEAERKLQLALAQVEEAKAAEKKAVEEMQVLSEKKGSVDNPEPSGRIKITLEEFQSLKAKQAETADTAEEKIAAAMAELEAIAASKNAAEQKLESNLKAMEEIKSATELAEKSAATSEAAQSALEDELRRRREQEEIPDAP